MLFRALKQLSSVFRIAGSTDTQVARNTIAWISFLLALPVALVVWLLFIVGYILFLPLLLLWSCLYLRAFQRKAGVFTNDGILLRQADGRLTIAWSDIREVVREREPKASFYRIRCGIAPADVREYIMSTTPNDDAFERTLHERRIPFKINDWLERSDTVA